MRYSTTVNTAQVRRRRITRASPGTSAIRACRWADSRSRALFWAPRFGIAYDICGTGSTVLRGGWGRFYFHTPQFTSGLDASAGVQSATINGVNTFAELRH